VPDSSHRRPITILGNVAVVVTLALGLLVMPLATDAQQPAKVPRIGWLMGAHRESAEHLVQAFLRGLRDLGWVEGENIVIEWRSAEGKFERLPHLAAELVRLRVDVIVAASPPTAVAAKSATSTIPIVMVVGGEPVELGLVPSLARPGGNITGLAFSTGPEIVGKQLQLLNEAVPKATRVAVLWNPTHPAHPPRLRVAEVAAQALGVQLRPVAARGPEEFDSAFSAMGRERASALLVLADAMFFQHRTRLAQLAVRSRLSSMYGVKEHVEAGGLMAYGASVSDLFRRAATYVDKILKGAKPGDIPVEQPTRFELIINLRTAKALGLTIPQSILYRADELIR
jgi:putative ABC transport system substrate-binding protein